jgi:hypothetical protein
MAVHKQEILLKMQNLKVYLESQASREVFMPSALIYSGPRLEEQKAKNPKITRNRTSNSATSRLSHQTQRHIESFKNDFQNLEKV